MGRGHLWALNIHEWGSSLSMGVIRHPWVLNVCAWVVIVVNGGHLCGVISVGGRGRLLVVMVFHVWVVIVIHGQLWSCVWGLCSFMCGQLLSVGPHS